MGNQAELSFYNLMVAKGNSCEKAPAELDMHGHVDFIINGQHKVEVKGLKRAKRSDSSTKNDWIYVEFKNVRGDAGWLYGKADYIAFEQPDGFIVVPRIKLLEYAETHCKLEWVNRPAPYKSYRRRDRPDEHVSVIILSDMIRDIPHAYFKY